MEFFDDEPQIIAAPAASNYKLCGTLVLHLLTIEIDGEIEGDYTPAEEEGFEPFELTEEMLQEDDDLAFQGFNFDHLVLNKEGDPKLKPLREARILELLETVEIDALNLDRFSLLHFACLFGSRNLFDAVIHHDPLLFQRSGEYDFSALDVAIIYDREELALLLINDPRMTAEELMKNHTGNNVSTAMQPMYTGNHILIEAVLEKLDGHSKFLVSEQCIQEGLWEAIVVMQTLNHTQFDRPFIHRNKQTTFLHLLVRSYSFNEALFNALVAFKPLLNFHDADGKTPLHVATDYAKLISLREGEMKKYLIDRLNKRQDVICKLLEAGCDPRISDGNDELVDFSRLPLVQQWINEKATRDAASLYATVVCVSDDYFVTGPGQEETGSARFFAVAKHLPMELQMILCNRACGRVEDNIPAALIAPNWSLVFRGQNSTDNPNL